ncbi:MAG: hypothetical protein FWC76_03370 [Defluviitaleaceae bacterium]|nr:hypothetical protein [Defluviitaleaceae bacterium]
MYDDGALILPGKGLIKVAGIIITIIAVPVAIAASMSGVNWFLIASPFLLAIGVFVATNSGATRRAYSIALFVLGIINLAVLFLAIFFAMLILSFAGAAVYTFPFLLFILGTLATVANIMLLVGAIKNIKAARR